MDLIPAETEPEDSSVLRRRDKFRSLKLISNVTMEQPLLGCHESSEIELGKLDNGLSYYVQANSNPKMRAALALAVKAGSVLEEEHERGVARTLPHLVFSATTNYKAGEIEKYLKSIGGEYCHKTYPDKTVYQLFVPVDNPDHLSQAISILAEFSTEIRVVAEDLERERGAIMKNFERKRNASIRRQQVDWALMLKGSKYVERVPLGSETVLGSVSAETVMQFYSKWYNLRNMAVVVVGHFPDTQRVVELIKAHFGNRSSPLDLPLIPQFEVPSHEEPRFSLSALEESDVGGPSVKIRCLMPVAHLKTVKDYRDLLVESLFMQALNQRLFEISNRKDPPFIACLAQLDDLVHPIKLYLINSTCEEKGNLEALESLLTELARIRLHGFTEREISVIRAWMMIAFEAVYVDPEQYPSNKLRYNYTQDFLFDAPVFGTEYRAQLQKTLLPSISSSEVAKYAEKFRTSSNCLISAIEAHPATLTIDDLKTVVSKINSLEDERNIPPWDEEDVPEEIDPDFVEYLYKAKYFKIGDSDSEEED